MLGWRSGATLRCTRMLWHGPAPNRIIAALGRNLFYLFCSSALAFSQGGAIGSQVLQPAPPLGNGGVAPFATVRVCSYTASFGYPCTSLVTLYADPTLNPLNTLPNPTSADQNGLWYAFVPQGSYLLQEVPITNGSVVYSTYIFSNGSASVSSVGLVMPSTIFTVSGSPVTTAGNLTVVLASQSQNKVFASPNGSSGAPLFRNVIGADFGSQSGNLFFASPNGSSGSPLFRAIAGADFGSQSANTVMGNCTGSPAVPVFGCSITANMLPSTLNNTTIPTLTSTTINTAAINGSGTATWSGPSIFNGPLTINNLINGGQFGGTIAINNNTGTGTTVNTLTVLTGAPATATIASVGPLTGGIIGVCVTNCTNSGVGVIQQTGQVNCVFDSATTSGDFVILSTTIAGDCHDFGSLPPPVGQNIGQVLSTNGVSGTYAIALTPLASQIGLSCSKGVTSVNASTTSYQPLNVCSLTGLNSLTKGFRITSLVSLTPGSSINSNVTSGFGLTSALGSYGSNTIASESSSSSTWNVSSTTTCMTTTTGATGVLTCSQIMTVGNLGGPAISNTSSATSFIPIDLTQPEFFGIACQFSAASASNSCTQSVFMIEQLN